MDPILTAVFAIAAISSFSIDSFYLSLPSVADGISPGPSAQTFSKGAHRANLSARDELECPVDVLPYSSLRHLKVPFRSMHIEGSKGGQLHYFGVSHTNDPEHSQFEQIEEDFYRIQPTMVFYEGPARSLPNDPTAAIQEAGEAGLIRYLATEQNVAVARLEPSRQAEIDMLLEQFTPEQVKLFYILRQVSELRMVWKTTSKTQLQKAVMQSIDQLSVFDGLKTVITTMDDFESSYRRYWQTPTQWWNVPSQWFHPVLTIEETGGVFTNDVHRTASTFRNRHMVQVLANAVNQGHRVMAMVGKGHLPLQAHALECRIQ